MIKMCLNIWMIHDQNVFKYIYDWICLLPKIQDQNVFKYEREKNPMD
jgi:hypothetical protein